MTTILKVNGVSYQVNLADYPPDLTLNNFLREQLRLTATKFMCLEGGCGACICVLSGKHPVTGEVRTWTVNSCLTLLNTCKDVEITTAEGIGNARIGYHPIQKRLADMNGSQCGFCTSGFVMNMYGLLESKGGKVTREEVENSFGSNICRCTGYRPILDAMKSFATDSTITLPSEYCEDIEDLSSKSVCRKMQQLCLENEVCHKQLTSKIYANGINWYWPTCLAELFDVLHALGEVIEEQYILVAGNTAHGVYRRSANIKYFIDINDIPELKQHSITYDALTLGANLSLGETMDIFLKAAKYSGYEYCQQLYQHFDLIAHLSVRNMGTLAGNLSTKKAHREFPSDIFILFEALNVQVVVQDCTRTVVKMSLEQYFKTTIPKTVIVAFELRAYPRERFIFDSYKVMPRAQNTHAYVNAAFLLEVETTASVVKSARICVGGIRKDFVHIETLEKQLIHKELFNKNTVTNIFTTLLATIAPEALHIEPTPEYRLKCACGLFYKYLLKYAPKDKIQPKYLSGGEILKRPLSSGSQTFETNPKFYPVTQAVQKLEGPIQCSGEAIYMNDILTETNAVYCAFVTATRVGATIERIDASDALNIPGVLAFYSAADIPGVNSFADSSVAYSIEEIFCSGRVLFYDQPLGMIVAESSEIANYATAAVKVMYSRSLTTVRPTLESVLNSDEMKDKIKESFEELFVPSDTADVSVNGIFELGPQYHFSMEPQTTIAVPFERVLKIYSATQWMDHTQAAIAKMLNMKISDIQFQVLRLGGAYGIKISRCNQVACAASLAAFKLKRPARFVQTLPSMMTTNGKRWSVISQYEFHAKLNGKIVGMRNNFFEDAGCSMNETNFLNHTITHATNCYEFTKDNAVINGQFVLTDAASTTFCRAPASLEGIAMMENIIEHIAFETKLDPADVRLANLKSGHKLAELLPRFMETREYRKRRTEIDDFNNKNRWMKRGIGLAIMEYPLFGLGALTATVAIYHADGSVVISHGGIEVGQGLNTKVAQVAAYVLGIPLQMIKMDATNTVNGANSFFTAGSLGSESICIAVNKACHVLNERLKPIKEELGKGATWQKIIELAFIRFINLIASDICRGDDIPKYEVFGLALTEVEIDVLTGSTMVKRVDILEDAGESLSPYMDIGQVEGGFVMALGYWLTEKLIYNRQTGQLLTNNTWTYKPPGAKDIPTDFRIELLQKNPNPVGFMRSKATGEPPVTLAVSVIFAIQHALQSARNDAGLKREWIRLGAPTTPETIVLNAGTDISTFSLE